MRSKKKKNKNIRTRKAPFFVLAEKLMENLKILNEIKECPDCKTIIEENMKICPKCGNHIENKLTYEENMDYIRAYIQDKIYTQNEIIQKLSKKLSRYEKIIEENELEDLFGIKREQDSMFFSPALTEVHESTFPWPTGWPSQPRDYRVIRVDDLRSRPPLNALVKDLQEKINKQQSLINKLRANKAGSEDFDE